MPQVWYANPEYIHPSLLWNEVRRPLLFSRSVVSNSLWPHGLQHARLPGPSLSPGVCSNPCPLSQCCCLTISSSASPFSSCLQSFWASGSFWTSQFFASGGQSIGTSALALVLPISIQGWFPLQDIHLNYDYFFVHYFYANAALKCLNFILNYTLGSFVFLENLNLRSVRAVLTNGLLDSLCLCSKFCELERTTGLMFQLAEM